MERQNRARAAAWAELENKLRSELEETVIQNEKLSKERSEFKTKYTRLERMANERESELKTCRSTIEDQTLKVSKFEAQIEELESEAEKRQEEYVKVERLANEGVARVRSEMTQTVGDSEERYRGQIEKLEKELHIEEEKRTQLEYQVEQLLDSSGMIMAPQAPQAIRKEATPKRLKQSQGQAEILAGALSGFGDSDDEDDAVNGLPRSEDESDITTSRDGGMSSYAALEQLNSRLKITQVELESLRASLKESERTRESLLQELSESRQAKEKLPLFEAKVKELTEENREMELEIRGLRDDVADVRELYRTQLNVLLEEKAASLTGATNGVANPLVTLKHEDGPQEEETPVETQEEEQ
jgi:chromosome segregation ATPase